MVLDLNNKIKSKKMIAEIRSQLEKVAQLPEGEEKEKCLGYFNKMSIACELSVFISKRGLDPKEFLRDDIFSN